MKRTFLILLLALSFSSVNAQFDSLISTNKDIIKATPANNALALTMFPTVEYGLLYKYHFNGFNFRIAGYIRPDPYERPLTNSIDMPYAINDSSLIYRDSSDTELHYDFRIGFEKQFMLHRFNSGHARPQFVLTAGLDFIYGTYTSEKSYGEGFVKYTTDTITGATYYLDETGMPVDDPADAFGYNTLAAESKWKYRKAGIAPVFSFRTGGARFPFWFGFQLGFNFMHYKIKSSSIDDPWNQYDPVEEKYTAFEPMMHLMFGIQF
jgi:hypothetical protein